MFTQEYVSDKFETVPAVPGILGIGTRPLERT